MAQCHFSCDLLVLCVSREREPGTYVVGGESLLLEQDLVAVGRGAVEGGHENVQVDCQSVHNDNLVRLRTCGVGQHRRVGERKKGSVGSPYTTKKSIVQHSWQEAHNCTERTPRKSK